MNFSKIHFNFTSHRKVYYLISLAILAIGVVSMLLVGLNPGVDFVSGTSLDVYLGQSFDEKQVGDLVDTTGFPADSIRTAGDQNEIAVVRYKVNITHEDVVKIENTMKQTYGDQVTISENTVNPMVGQELVRKAIYAVLLASLGIILYVTIRFEYRFAISAVLALLYDAFFIIALFSVFQVEVNLPFIAAILTIIGYSINDKIVIFDRIRENMKTAKVKRFEDLEEVVNHSINQTLARSINTVLTVMFAAFALFIFGGEGIRNFSLALLFGLFSGAYSSIFLASQLWLDWRGNELKKGKAAQTN